jgi:GNAT superfamily N-acetyltransferase
MSTPAGTPDPPPVSVLEADLTRPDHQLAVRALTNAYAADPMGNGAALSDPVLDRVVDALRAHPTARVFLAYVGTEPVGIATCFTGFSTFAARPVLNVHDLAVLAGWRGRGVGRALLEAVESAARASGCARLTLEVGDRNIRARRAYEAAGFAQAHYGDAGHALFYVKTL